MNSIISWSTMMRWLTRTVNGLVYALASSIVTGLVGQVVPRGAALSVASGVMFGAAMVGVGRQMLRVALKVRRTSPTTP